MVALYFVVSDRRKTYKTMYEQTKLRAFYATNMVNRWVLGVLGVRRTNRVGSPIAHPVPFKTAERHYTTDKSNVTCVRLAKGS